MYVEIQIKKRTLSKRMTGNQSPLRTHEKHEVESKVMAG